MFKTAYAIGLLAFGFFATCVCRVALAGSSQDYPTQVSIRGRDIPVRQVYDDIERQSKIKFYMSGYSLPDERRVSLNLVSEPFWEAIERVSKPAGLEVQAIRREPNYEVIFVPVTNLRDRRAIGRDASGLFFGTLYDVASDKELDAPVDANKSLPSELHITLRPEPKSRAMIWHSIQVEEFVDEYGRSINYKLGSRLANFTEGSAVAILNLPTRPWPRKIGRLKIRGKVMASVRSETAEITQLMWDVPPAITAAGFRFESKASTTPTGRRLTLNMTRLGSTAPEWMNPSSRLMMLNPIVVNSLGQQFGLNWLGRGWYGKTFRFDMEVRTPTSVPGDKPFGDPKKLLLEVPTETADYDVKFEFTDANVH